MSHTRAVTSRPATTAARRYARTQIVLRGRRYGPADTVRTSSSSAPTLRLPSLSFNPTGSRGAFLANVVSFPNHVSINNVASFPAKCQRRHVATSKRPPPKPLEAKKPPASSFKFAPTDARSPKTRTESDPERINAELDERKALRKQVEELEKTMSILKGEIVSLKEQLDRATRDAERWQNASKDLEARRLKEQEGYLRELADKQDAHSQALSSKQEEIKTRDSHIDSLNQKLANVRANVRAEIRKEAHDEGLRIAGQEHEERHSQEMQEMKRQCESLLQREREELQDWHRTKEQEREQKSEQDLGHLRHERRADQEELGRRHQAFLQQVLENRRQAAEDLAEARTERLEMIREREEASEQLKEDATKAARQDFQDRQRKFRGTYDDMRDAVAPKTDTFYPLDSMAGKISAAIQNGTAFAHNFPSIALEMDKRVSGFSLQHPALCSALENHAKAQGQSIRDSVQSLDQDNLDLLRRGRLFGFMGHVSREMTKSLRYKTMASRDLVRQTVDADLLAPVDVKLRTVESEWEKLAMNPRAREAKGRQARQLMHIHALIRLLLDINEFEELLRAPYGDKLAAGAVLDYHPRYQEVLDTYKRGHRSHDEGAKDVRDDIDQIRVWRTNLEHIVRRRGWLEGHMGSKNKIDEERLDKILKERLEDAESQFWQTLDMTLSSDLRFYKRRAAGTVIKTSASPTPRRARTRTLAFRPTARRASAHVAFTSALNTSEICRIWSTALRVRDQEEHNQCAVTRNMASPNPPSDNILSGVGTITRGMSDTSLSRPDGTKVLTYAITSEDFQNTVSAPQTSPAAFWSYKLYRSPSGATPVLHYCTKFEQAEEQAQKFLGAAVLGFDIEWESGASIAKSRIKDNVSLIQIASEDRIGLFQLGMFKGETIEELMPPSLRLILESASTVKAGVNIAGDATRLRSCLDVNMSGLIELSHLYRIVRYSEHKPGQVNRRLVAMAEQVQDVLRLPLSKDNTVRTGAWSRKLNGFQCDYAGSDAYAGFQLYHELEAQRQKMQPTPPRPAFYELFQPLVLGDGREIPATKSSRPRTSTRACVVDDELDEDEAYFDAVENLEGLKLEDDDDDQLNNRRIVYPSLPPGLDRDPVRSSSISQTVSSPKPTTDKPKRQPLPRSAEVDRADAWVAEWKTSLAANYKLASSDQKLRAYHLWHEQALDVKQVAAKIGAPPLSNMTVAKYVLDVVKDEGLAYDGERIKQPLNMLPTYLRWRFQKIADHAGL